MDFKDLKDFDELIDAVVEWIGRKWTKSMIKRELRETFPGVELRTMNCVINKARAKIRELYNIDPSDYKGSQISFYESVIRGKNKIEAKLTAAERLDRLFGLEHISGANPNDVAKKIQEALKEIDESVSGEQKNGRSENGRERQDDAEQVSTNNNNTKETKQNISNSMEENNVFSPIGIRSKDVEDDSELFKEDIEKLKLRNEEGL